MAVQSLQDPYLNTLRKERTQVAIFLMNGIKLQGYIESFDQFVILLKNNTSQMIYKHAISTIVPATPVRINRDTVKLEKDEENQEQQLSTNETVESEL